LEKKEKDEMDFRETLGKSKDFPEKV